MINCTRLALWIRRLGPIWIATCLVACAHQTVNSELVESGRDQNDIVAKEVTSEPQLQAMVSGAADEVSNQAVDEVASELTASTQVSTQPTVAVADAKSTDDLVVEIEPEPVTVSVTGRPLQGQQEMLGRVQDTLAKNDETVPKFSENLAGDSIGSRRVVKTIPSKKGIVSGEVPEVSSAIPAKSETREPGSIDFPESATVVPKGDAPANSQEGTPPLMDPTTTEDQLKSEVESEKILASPEIGGVITRPWFPWVAIFAGATGFTILGVLKFKKKRSESSQHR